MAEIMISDTPMRVIVNGVDAVFEPGKERPVRDSLVETAKQMGARVVGAKAEKVEPTAEATPDDVAIESAIRELLDSNSTKAFGADGKPKVRSIERLLGSNIDAADRDRVWSQMNG